LHDPLERLEDPLPLNVDLEGGMIVRPSMALKVSAGKFERITTGAEV
jgi:hypothetical protein